MNRRKFLAVCGLSPASLVVAPAFADVKIDPAQLRQKYTTMEERHEHYKKIAQALHDYGLDIYFLTWPLRSARLIPALVPPTKNSR